MSAPTTTQEAPAGAFRSALTTEYRRMSNLELLADREANAYETIEMLELGNSPGADLARVWWQERRDAIEAELSRRQRLHAARPDACADPGHISYEQALDLARRLHDDHGELHVVLAKYGCPVVKVGWSSRRQCDELAGPCPLCGGTDRFRVWPGPPGYAWCRRCGTGGDILAWYRSLTGASVFEALRTLASEIGLRLPDAPPAPVPAAIPQSAPASTPVTIAGVPLPAVTGVSLDLSALLQETTR